MEAGDELLCRPSRGRRKREDEVGRLGLDREERDIADVRRDIGATVVRRGYTPRRRPAIQRASHKSQLRGGRFGGVKV